MQRFFEYHTKKVSIHYLSIGSIYRDIASLYDIKKPELLEKLLYYTAGITGQILNISNISNSIGLSREYVNTYLYYLKSAFIVFTLRKYAKSIEKTVRSNEKVFLLDRKILDDREVIFVPAWLFLLSDMCEAP